MNIYEYNKQAWKNEVEGRNSNTIPLSAKEFAFARNGEIYIPLTPTKPVPLEWLGELQNKKVLCLAASGGQQAPLFALLGAEVTVFDICPEQLERDIEVANRENLQITAIQGNMLDLYQFENESFDLIFHAVSNCFVDNILPLWNECYRVLKPGGTLIAGFLNPINYLFDMDALENGKLEVAYSIPYSDLKDLSQERLKQYIDNNEPLEFGHTLEDQIGGQLRAGFVIKGFYEDNNGGKDPLDQYMNIFIATLAMKEVKQ